MEQRERKGPGQRRRDGDSGHPGQSALVAATPSPASEQSGHETAAGKTGSGLVFLGLILVANRGEFLGS